MKARRERHQVFSVSAYLSLLLVGVECSTLSPRQVAKASLGLVPLPFSISVANIDIQSEKSKLKN